MPQWEDLGGSKYFPCRMPRQYRCVLRLSRNDDTDVEAVIFSLYLYIFTFLRVYILPVRLSRNDDTDVEAVIFSLYLYIFTRLPGTYSPEGCKRGRCVTTTGTAGCFCERR